MSASRPEGANATTTVEGSLEDDISILDYPSEESPTAHANSSLVTPRFEITAGRSSSDSSASHFALSFAYRSLQRRHEELEQRHQQLSNQFRKYVTSMSQTESKPVTSDFSYAGAAASVSNSNSLPGPRDMSLPGRERPGIRGGNQTAHGSSSLQHVQSGPQLIDRGHKSNSSGRLPDENNVPNTHSSQEMQQDCHATGEGAELHEEFIAFLQQRLEEEKMEKQILSRDLEEERRKNSVLQQDLLTKQQVLESQEKDAANIQSSLQAQITFLESGKTKEMADMTEAITKLKGQLAEADQRHQDDQKEKNNLRVDMADIVSQSYDLNGQVQRLQSAQEVLKQEQTEDKVKLGAIQKEASELRQENQKLLIMRDGIEGQLRHLQAECQRLQDENMALEAATRSSSVHSSALAGEEEDVLSGTVSHLDGQMREMQELQQQIQGQRHMLQQLLKIIPHRINAGPSSLPMSSAQDTQNLYGDSKIVPKKGSNKTLTSVGRLSFQPLPDEWLAGTLADVSLNNTGGSVRRRPYSEGGTEKNNDVMAGYEPLLPVGSRGMTHGDITDVRPEAIGTEGAVSRDPLEEHDVFLRGFSVESALHDATSQVKGPPTRRHSSALNSGAVRDQSPSGVNQAFTEPLLPYSVARPQRNNAPGVSQARNNPAQARPLNMERNRDEPVGSSPGYGRAANLTCNPNLNIGETLNKTPHSGTPNHLPVLNNDPLAGHKIIPERNLYTEERSQPTGMENMEQSDYHAGAAAPTRTCPVCNDDYPNMTQLEFEGHVFRCVESPTENEELTMTTNTRDSGNKEKVCPVCNNIFPPSYKQEDFELHVDSHFKHETSSIINQFELIDPHG